MFQLHPRLKEDCFLIAESELSLLLLLNDARYPWFIMVPKRADIKEVFQLSENEQIQLLKESSFLANSVLNAFGGDKMNIASLGNMVPQLHIHHIVRFKNDPAWPGPVWGHSKAIPYSDIKREETIEVAREHLKEIFNFY